jgi:hypothetical protein
MSDNHLTSVQKVLSAVQTMDKLNDRQIAALRANITKAIAACKEAGDKQMEAVLLKVEAKLPERKAAPAKEAQTVEEIVAEYDNDYQKKTGSQQAAFKAKLTRRVNQAEAEKLTEDYNQLLALQARMERESEEIRRKFILGLAEKLIDG